MIGSEAAVEWAAYLTAKLALKMAAPDEWEAYTAAEAEFKKAMTELVKAAPDEFAAYEKAIAELIKAKAAYEEELAKDAEGQTSVAAVQAAKDRLETAQMAYKKTATELAEAAPDEYAAWDEMKRRVV